METQKPLPTINSHYRVCTMRRNAANIRLEDMTYDPWSLKELSAAVILRLSQNTTCLPSDLKEYLGTKALVFRYGRTKFRSFPRSSAVGK